MFEARARIFEGSSVLQSWKFRHQTLSEGQMIFQSRRISLATKSRRLKSARYDNCCFLTSNPVGLRGTKLRLKNWRMPHSGNLFRDEGVCAAFSAAFNDLHDTLQRRLLYHPLLGAFQLPLLHLNTGALPKAAAASARLTVRLILSAAFLLPVFYFLPDHNAATIVRCHCRHRSRYRSVWYNI